MSSVYSNVFVLNEMSSFKRQEVNSRVLRGNIVSQAVLSCGKNGERERVGEREKESGREREREWEREKERYLNELDYLYKLSVLVHARNLPSKT